MATYQSATRRHGAAVPVFPYTRQVGTLLSLRYLVPQQKVLPTLVQLLRDRESIMSMLNIKSAIVLSWLLQLRYA